MPGNLFIDAASQRMRLCWGDVTGDDASKAVAVTILRREKACLREYDMSAVAGVTFVDSQLSSV